MTTPAQDFERLIQDITPMYAWSSSQVASKSATELQARGGSPADGVIALLLNLWALVTAAKERPKQESIKHIPGAVDFFFADPEKALQILDEHTERTKSESSNRYN